jgi:hypothetical protein
MNPLLQQLSNILATYVLIRRLSISLFLFAIISNQNHLPPENLQKKWHSRGLSVSFEIFASVRPANMATTTTVALERVMGVTTQHRSNLSAHSTRYGAALRLPSSRRPRYFACSPSVLVVVVE